MMRRKKLNGRREDDAPQRTCVGCGKTGARQDLERFVFVEGSGLIHDLRRKAPGRGAWIHPRRPCFLRACGGGFSRAMRRRVVVEDPEGLSVQIERGLEQRLLERLTEVLRAGQAVVGQTLVQQSLKRDAIEVLILARDSGESTEQKFVQNAGRKGVKVFRRWSGEELGRLTGREFVSVIGVESGGALERLLREQARLESWIGEES